MLSLFGEYQPRKRPFSEIIPFLAQAALYFETTSLTMVVLLAASLYLVAIIWNLSARLTLSTISDLTGNWLQMMKIMLGSQQTPIHFSRSISFRMVSCSVILV